LQLNGGSVVFEGDRNHSVVVLVYLQTKLHASLGFNPQSTEVDRRSNGSRFALIERPVDFSINGS
jgi:hypothetical protein